MKLVGRLLLAAAALTASTASAFAQSPLPVTITRTGVVVVALTTDNANPIETTDPQSAVGTRQGKEANPCAADAVQSRVTASSNLEFPSDGGAGTVPFRFEGVVSAAGGHTAQCPGCVAPCLAAADQRTAATAKARLRLQFDLHFQKDLGAEAFEVSIEGQAPGGAQTAEFLYTVAGADGRQLGGGVRINGRAITFIPADGETIAVTIIASVFATGTGTSQESARQLIDGRLVLRPAPILATRSGTFRIIKGTPTESFPEVGALLVNGKLQCTGTLVNPRTVLTAAHCVDRWSPAELSFLFDKTATPSSSAVLVEVKDRRYPQGEEGFVFSRAKKTDDVALVILKRDITEFVPVKFYDGKPSIDQCCLSTPPTFVGFGYGDEQFSPEGQGVKRLALIKIQDWNNRDFVSADEVQQVNTCEGDSGGPAFLIERNNVRRVLGVVSHGDPDCKKFGVNMRIDAYAPWFKKFVSFP